MVPFPPLLAVTLGTLGAALLVRHIAREWQRARDIERQAKAPVTVNETAIPKLRRDPDGIYRP
jgi:hypothetical protein